MSEGEKINNIITTQSITLFADYDSIVKDSFPIKSAYCKTVCGNIKKNRSKVINEINKKIIMYSKNAK